MAAARSRPRRLDTRYAGAEHQHPLRRRGLQGREQLRLGALERLEFGADHRVVHAGNVLLQREPLETEIARDALADRRIHAPECLEAPMRVGVKRAPDGNEVRAAIAQQSLRILGIDDPARDENRNLHRLFDRPGIGSEAAAPE